MKFTDFPLDSEVLESVLSMGFENATPIQEQAIPVILENKDLIGCAQTGTGKTAAFLIPLIQKLRNTPGNKIKALVIVPTRELAIQIDQAMDGLSYFTGVSSFPVYGGGQGDVFSDQKKAIIQGADLLIATPGRLLAHIKLGYVDFSSLNTLILDEADRMLDMGFFPDIKTITEKLPEERQSLMFSATMASEIRKLSNQILKEPEQINLAIAKPAEGITQRCFLVYDGKKIALLEHLLAEEEVQNMLIFASRKTSVDTIVRSLQRKNYDARSIHSGKSQDERNETLRAFRNGHVKILVATDILSRGIDIEGLSHVVNYDIPDDAADYVHRIGRTARADATGMAISFINEDDQFKISNIEALIEKELEKEKTPESIGESPEYDPNRRPSRGRGRGRGRGHGGGGGRGRSHGGGKGQRHQGNRNRNKDRNASAKPGGDTQNNNQGGSSSNKKKKRPFRRKKKGGGSNGNAAPPSSQGKE
ncbi:MAG: DEAD/DEAH box helicase [Salibacteraceae bacterium]